MIYTSYQENDVPETQLEVERAKRVGGRLCLDFVNTVKTRTTRGGSSRGRDLLDQVEGERLVSYDALLRWSTLAGALTEREGRDLEREAAARPARAAAALKRSLALREAMYRVFKNAIEHWTPADDDLATVNHELRAARAHEHLAGSPRMAWQWDADPARLDRMLWPVVRSAAELLTSPELERVRQCPGEACGWLFLDNSRSRRRQWCDMADCGNLAKVRRFRERQR